MRAEIDRVWTGGDQLTVELRLQGAAGARPRAAAVVARRRQDGAEVTGSVALAEDHATATLPLAPLEPAGDRREVWDLSLRAADVDQEVRLVARADDDVPTKATSYVFPPRIVETGPGSRRRYRPFYEDDDTLALRSTAVGPGGGASRRARRRRPGGRRSARGHALLVAHRGALAALRVALRLRPRAPARSDRPRVVLLLAHAYGVGGTTRTVLNLAAHLAGAGHDVEVLSVVRRREQAKLPLPAGVRITPVDTQLTPPAGPLDRLLSRLPSLLLLPADRRMREWASLRTDVRLVRALWRVRDGVVMGTRPSLNVLVSAVRRPGLVAIGQEHMNLSAHRPELRAELLRCYRRLDAAVLLTEGDRAGYREALGEGPTLVAIPNAVPELPGPRSSLDRPVAIAVGRLTPQKGFDRLIPAFAKVVERHPEWTLRICGGGRLRKELERLVGEHDLANHVTLLGSISDIERQLAASSMFILSSRFEGLPMAMIEAMSKGLPVVAFDCPTGPAEVVEHGRSGLLVPNGDVEALAAAILELIEDEARRHAYGAAAAQRAEAFSLPAVGARWDNLITALR